LRFLGFWGLVRCGGRSEELKAEGQESRAPPIGQKAEVPDSHEGQRQQVEQETAQELIDRERHQALLIAVSGVSPTKSNLVTGQGDKAMIGDGDAVRVAAQVSDNLLRAAEGWFAIDDPIVAEELPEKRGESLGLGEQLEIAVEAELAGGEGTLESGDELAAEDTTEHLDGEKEAIAWVDPTPVIGREAAGRNHAVNMGMMLQLLIPSMEHAEEADFCAEMLRGASDFEQGFGAGAEEQVVDDLLVLQGQARGARRRGKVKTTWT
jgi:hypothetical protein